MNQVERNTFQTFIQVLDLYYRNRRQVIEKENLLITLQRFKHSFANML